jgi:hypothetical protein
MVCYICYLYRSLCPSFPDLCITLFLFNGSRQFGSAEEAGLPKAAPRSGTTLPALLCSTCISSVHLSWPDNVSDILLSGFVSNATHELDVAVQASRQWARYNVASQSGIFQRESSQQSLQLRLKSCEKRTACRPNTTKHLKGLCC